MANFHDGRLQRASYTPPAVFTTNTPTSTPTYQSVPTDSTISVPSQAVNITHSYSGLVRVLWKTLLVGLFSISLAIGTFAYIYLNRSSADDGTVQTSIPLGTVLLLFSVASKAALICIPLVMSAAAFHTADTWLHQSQQGTTDPAADESPSPYEYRLLLNIFTSGNVFAAWTSLKYIMQRRRGDGSSHAVSHILQTSFITLWITLILTYTIISLDFILHHFSTATLVRQSPTFNDRNRFQYGRRLKSECLTVNEASNTPCTIQYEFRPMSHMDQVTITAYPEALHIGNGDSMYHAVATAPLPDNNAQYAAALVPARTSITPGATFEADTVGMYATCQVVTNSCVFNTNCRGVGCISVSCQPPGYPATNAYTVIAEQSLYTYNPSTNKWVPNQWNGTLFNNYTFHYGAAFDIDADTSQNGMENNNVWGHGNESPYATILLICSVTVADMKVQYVDPSLSTITSSNNTTFDESHGFTVLSYTPTTSNATTRAVTAVLDMPFSPVNTLYDVLQPLAVTLNATEFVRAFEREYARTYLPFAHSAFEVIPATSTSVTAIVEGAIIPTPGLLVYSGLLILFGLFALLQGGLAMGVSKTALWKPKVDKARSKGKVKSEEKNRKDGEWINIAQLAAERLTSSCALVYEALERRRRSTEENCSHSVQSAGIEMFAEGTRGEQPGIESRVLFSIEQRGAFVLG